MHHWQEWKMVQPPGITVWQFLKRLNIESYGPIILLLGYIHPREVKTYVHILKKMQHYS